ncbi:MAG TPA: ribosome maturation factor RimM [Cyclobacteriaceae bacterium]|nr:ribosome maturation factor RimM [Cyclobacteriaceae bacterium]
MKISDCFKIGNIYKSHGLKGEVSIYLMDEAPTDFSQIEMLLIEQSGNLVPFFIESISFKANKAYVKFEDVDSKETADTLRGKQLYLPLEQRETLPKGEYYEEELIGLMVSDQQLGPLGKVTALEKSGLSKLLVIDFEGRELLIPYNSPLILNIDTNKHTISVNLPEGYLDF